MCFWRQFIGLAMVLAFWIVTSTPECAAQVATGETVLTRDGAWCWFQDPRAVYVNNRRERTYAQWMTREGKLQVAAFDHKTASIEVHTLKENWDRDDHNVGAFLVLPDKRLMVFYARHNKKGIFCRTSTEPEDIKRWGREVTVCNNEGITYAHPVYLSAEKRLYVFWRGKTWKPTFATSRDGITWSQPNVLIQDMDRSDQSVRPYTKITSDGEASIHIAFTDGHPRNEPENSVYYLCYRDGRFLKADGSQVGDLSTLPIAHSQSDLVYNGKSTNVRAWVWDVALDSDGHPVIAYTRLPTEKEHYYWCAQWSGKEWLDVEITAGGKWFPRTPDGASEREPHYSGGMAIDQSSSLSIYVSRPINNVFEIEKWSAPKVGKKWTRQPITGNSKQDNVRPVTPRGVSSARDHVLWMNGTYKHYTDYNTGIRMLHIRE